MVLFCSSCGARQLGDVVKFCCECGARIGKPTVTETQPDALITPVEGRGSRNPRTRKKEPEKVIALCKTCRELVCVAGLTSGPQKHSKCGNLISPDDRIGTKDPFKEQKRIVSETLQTQQKLLENLKAIKSNAGSGFQIEMSKLQGIEKDALKALDDKHRAAIAKLNAEKNKRKHLIQDAIKGKTEGMNQKAQQNLLILQERIGDVTAQVDDLTDVVHMLEPPFGPDTLTQLVEASKEAEEVLKQTHVTATPRMLMVVVTPEESQEMHEFADPPPSRPMSSVTKPVTANDGGRGTSAAVARPRSALPSSSQQPPAAAANTAGGSTPLTGPGSTRHFVKGARVIRGPDWLDGWDFHDAHGPGTVSDVSKYGGGLAVDVAWDLTGYKGWYRVGVKKQYQLQLLPPQASQ